MIQVDNHSGLPHLLYEKCAPSGGLFDILVLRGTFDFARDGAPMTLAAEQRPILFGDRYDGPVSTQPLKAVIAEEGDLVLGKPRTDILIQGHLRSLRGRPLKHWLAEFKVGPVSKAIRVSGPRAVHESLTGWQLGEAAAVNQVPLDYRLAFGGCFYDPQPPAEGESAASIHYPTNPAGCGWLPTSSELTSLDKVARLRIEERLSSIKQMPAPQLEDPQIPYKHPHQKLTPQGCGPIARWWEPRVSLQGTYDQRWEEERYPFLPEDFDPRFYQSAPADLVSASYLTGNELVQLKGCLADGDCTMRLPGVVPLVVINENDPDGHIQIPPLDTVRIDLDNRQAIFRPQRWNYRWNSDNRLTELLTPNDEHWRYAYDAFGRRIRKFQVIHGNPQSPQLIVGEEYLWSGEQLLEAAPLCANGEVLYQRATSWTYAPGSATPIAQRRNGQLCYIVADHLGSPRELLSEQGELVWSNSPNVWGLARLWKAANDDITSEECPFRFPGQYYDAESGLHYNRHRYYDPQTAQYLSPDPLGLCGGNRPQGYVHNPMGWADPLGLAGNCTVGQAISSIEEQLSKGKNALVTVGSKSDAEEVLRAITSGENHLGAYMDTSTPKTFSPQAGASDWLPRPSSSKRGTYHWDEYNPNAKAGDHAIQGSHLQIHTFEGKIIRIFY